MKIKAFLNIARKNFDRIILIAMVLLLMVLTIRYLGLVREGSGVFTEKDLYGLIGLASRPKGGAESTGGFSQMIEKKTNLILGLRPPLFYKRLKERNPFADLKEVMVMPLTIKPVAIRIKVGDKFPFQVLNGIGPYRWECEPETLGSFEGAVFEAQTSGLGKIMVTDARGHKASAEKVEVVTTGVKPPRPPKTDRNFIYRGLMKIVTPKGEEILANIEETGTGRTHFKKEGEEISGFVVKAISADKLILADDKGKEIEINRE